MMYHFYRWQISPSCYATSKKSCLFIRDSKFVSQLPTVIKFICPSTYTYTFSTFSKSFSRCDSNDKRTGSGHVHGYSFLKRLIGCTALDSLGFHWSNNVKLITRDISMSKSYLKGVYLHF